MEENIKIKHTDLRKIKKESWKDKYDKVNSTFDGDVVIFDGHYNLKSAKKIIEVEGYDESNEYKKVEHVWIHFGFIHYEGELTNGWSIMDGKPKNMRGKLKATLVTK